MVRNPWLRIRNDAAAEMHRFGSEFGLSPASRARLQLTDPAAAAQDRDLAAGYF
jgi:P27 family predicted phage terminase small subunit